MTPAGSLAADWLVEGFCQYMEISIWTVLMQSIKVGAHLPSGLHARHHDMLSVRSQLLLSIPGLQPSPCPAMAGPGAVAAIHSSTRA